MNRVSQKGFTLIELLVVFSVLGILAGVVLVSANPIGQFNKGRDGQRKSDLSQIQTALEFYRTDSGSYPASLPFCGQPLNYVLNGNTVNYLSKTPCDPSSGLGYAYVSPAGNTNYCLKACLQNGADKDRDEIKYGLNNPGLSEVGCAINAPPGYGCGGAQPKSYTITNP